MLHAGQAEGAKRLAKATIASFEAAGVDTVVVNAAGCGSSMKEYGRLLAGDPGWGERAAAFSAKVRDVTELLADLTPRAPRHPVPARVAYHDACHLAHAQKVRAQPRAVLGAIPGVELVELAEPEICCGSAGIYNLLEPAPAEELGRRKAASVLATGADVLATGNPGCLLQLGRELDGDGPRLVHPVELVDASISGTGLGAGPSRPVPRAAPRAALVAAAGLAAAVAVAVAARRRGQRSPAL
jgi:glycolate oxidase iron-sulfur subunit